MGEQGCSRLSSDENGRILDRLAGWRSSCSRASNASIENTGKQDKRVCDLTNSVMIQVVLAMGLFTELPIRQVFKVCRRLREGEAGPIEFMHGTTKARK